MSGFLGGGIGPRAIGGASAAAANGLLNNLIAYWPLNEAGGANNALDMHGALHLTQNSSPGSDTGKVYAGARTFDGATQYFSRASEAAIQVGGVSFAMAAWMYRSGAIGAVRRPIGKGPPAGNVEYEFIVAGADNLMRFQFYVTAYRFAIASTFGPIPLNEWFLCVGWFDYEKKELGISINNGAGDIVATADAPESLTGALAIGHSNTDGSSSTFWPGRIGPVAFWKNRTLDAAARAALWNGGAGLAYAAFTA